MPTLSSQGCCICASPKLGAKFRIVKKPTELPRIALAPKKTAGGDENGSGDVDDHGDDDENGDDDIDDEGNAK